MATREKPVPQQSDIVYSLMEILNVAHNSYTDADRGSVEEEVALEQVRMIASRLYCASGAQRPAT